jgi:hypothetical protein
VDTGKRSNSATSSAVSSWWSSGTIASLMIGSESSTCAPTGAAELDYCLGADGSRGAPHCVADRLDRVVAHDRDVLVSQVAAQDSLEPGPVL